MNSTIDESNKIVYPVGGRIIPLPEQDKIVEMPKEDARDIEVVAEDTFIGEQLQEIRVGSAKAEDILSKEQVKELEETRKKRKTKAVTRRKEANQR